MKSVKRSHRLFERLKVVIFDFDGTLTRPEAIDYSAIREAIGCSDDRPILEYIESLEDIQQKQIAHQILERHELDAAKNSMPNDGAEDLLLGLLDRGIMLAIVSRNGLKPIEKAMENFTRVSLSDFELVITRLTDLPPKPAPDTIYYILSRLGIHKDQALVVGDFRFDIEAGNAAGVVTVLLDNRERESQAELCNPDIVIDSLNQLLPGLHVGK